MATGVVASVFVASIAAEGCGSDDSGDGDGTSYLIEPVEAGRPKLDAAPHLDAAAEAAHDAAVDAAADTVVDAPHDVPDVTPDVAADTGTPDAPRDAPVDSALLDTGPPDTGVVDTSVVDTSIPDTSSPDTEVVETGMQSGCAPALEPAPPGPAVCGDGYRALTEECDDGLGTSTLRRGCSAQCQVLDELPLEDSDGGVSQPPRTLGVGRHPLAVSDNTFAVSYFEPSSNPPVLTMAMFSGTGVATGTVHPFSLGSTVDDSSNPVLAAMPCDQYVAAWTELDAPNGDELDVALRLVNSSVPASGAPAIANVTTNFSQSDPDVIWTGSEIVVAWVDDSNTATAPDIFYRTFDSDLNPTSGEIPLAVLPDSEADVALAPFAGSWAAAWRDDSAGLETVQVVVGSEIWPIGPAFLPAPVPSKPALTAIDATHLLVVFAVGVDTVDAGVANASQLEMAVINTQMPGLPVQLPLTAMVPAAQGLSQSQPSAVVLGGNAFVAWWTAAATGDPNGEQLWWKQVHVVGGIPMTQAAEISLPRWAQAQVGDQRSPALAVSPLFSGGAVVAAWDDLGRGLGAVEADEDVAVEFVPVPVLREAGGTGGP